MLLYMTWFNEKHIDMNNETNGTCHVVMRNIQNMRFYDGKHTEHDVL